VWRSLARRPWLVVLLVGGGAWIARGQSFLNFESGHVRPLALSPAGDRLFAVNTPDNRLEIYTITAGGLSLGQALVAAEDLPRRLVLRRASRDALVLLIGCLPWFIVLGVVEAVVSPAPTVPAPMKAALGLGLEACFLLLAWNPLLPAERR